MDEKETAPAAPEVAQTPAEPEEAEQLEETPAEASAAEQEAPEAAADETSDEPTDLQPKQKGRLQKRFDRLTAENRALMERLAALEAQQRAAQPQAEARPFDPTPYIGAPPDPKSFELGEYDPKYAAALAKYELRSETAQAHLAQQRRDAEAYAARLADSFRERAAKAAERYEDFHEVAASNDHPVTTAMAQTIVLTESGPDVAYWLGKNKSEAVRIANLPPAAQSFELGKIAARLEAQREAAKETKAAPPPPSVKGNSRREKAPLDMTDAEFSAHMAKIRAALA